MEETFDPYLKWLAISEPQRPPNHYALLGVRLFETDPEVISNAADRQMAHIRTFQMGKHSALSQRLLNELAAARVALLNSQKKRAYDTELRAKLAARKRAAPRSASPKPTTAAPVVAVATTRPEDEYSVAPTVSAAASATAPVPAIEISTGASRRVQRKKSSTLIPFAMILVGLVGVVGAAAWMLNKRTEVAQNQAASAPSAMSAAASPATTAPAPEAPASEAPSASESAAGDDNMPDGAVVSATPPAVPSGASTATPALPNERNEVTAGASAETSVERPKEQEVESPDEGSNPPDSVTDGQTRTDNPRTNEVSGDDSDGDALSGPPDPTASQANVAEESTESAPATSRKTTTDSRAAIPSKAAQVEATKRLEDVYGAELAGAKSTESKVNLALKLLNEGIKSTDDRAAQYVILGRAIELASDGEDLATALRAADVLAEKFQYSSIKSKVDAAETVLKKVNIPAAARAAIEESLELVDTALAQDAFEEVTRLLGAVRKAVRKAKDPSLASRLKRLADESRASEKEFNASRKAAEMLETDPDDPESNFILGSYTCFYRHSWDEGLALLKKGVDPDFRRAATLDLQKPQAADKQLVVADQWWDLAQQSKGQTQRACEERAVFWYEKALPRLTGLNQSKANDRVFATIFGKTKLWATNPKDGGANLGHADSRFPPECTLELWFTTSVSTGTLITKRQQEPEGSLTIVIQDGRLRGWANGSFYLVEVHGDQTVNDGKWHHVALVKTPGQMQLYVDGRPGGTAGIRDDYNSQSPWTLGIHRINTSHAGPIDARYCRLRFSATARYTGPFKPDQRYGADQATVFLE
jgi:hypothetical protein